MNLIEQARKEDALEHPKAAVELYEEAFNAGEGDFKDYINCAVLMFVCLDYGHAHYHKLDMTFGSHVEKRALEVLKEAEAKFGKHPDIEYWNYYFELIHYKGVSDNLDKHLDRLIKEGSIDALMSLHPPIKDNVLREHIKGEENERARYIKGILDSSVRNDSE